MSVQDAQVALNEARAAVIDATSTLQAAQDRRTANINAAASGNSSAQSSLANDAKAIANAREALEIAEARAAHAQRTLEVEQASAEAKEIEELRREWDDLRGAVNQAAAAVDQHVIEARNAAKAHAGAMDAVKDFHRRHAERLRLRPVGQPPAINVELTTQGYAHNRTSIVSAPRFEG